MGEAEVVPFKLRDTHSEEKWEELQNLGMDLESAPSSSRRRQRLEQRLQHLRNRLSHLDDQIPEPAKKESFCKGGVAGGSRVPLRAPEPLPPATVDVAVVVRKQSAPLSAFTGTVTATYQQLLNTIGDIVKQMPEVDWLDETSFMVFLWRLFSLADFPGISDRTVLQLVYRYYRGAYGRADHPRYSPWCWTPSSRGDCKNSCTKDIFIKCRPTGRVWPLSVDACFKSGMLVVF